MKSSIKEYPEYNIRNLWLTHAETNKIMDLASEVMKRYNPVDLSYIEAIWSINSKKFHTRIHGGPFQAKNINDFEDHFLPFIRKNLIRVYTNSMFLYFEGEDEQELARQLEVAMVIES